MKPVIKKTLSIVLVALLLLLAFAPSNISFNKGVIVQGENGSYQMQSFTNDRFSTELDDYNNHDEYVDFNSLYSIITKNISSADETLKTTLQSTVQTKKVAIYTPDDLYNLSASVSFNFTSKAAVGNTPKLQTIEYLLGLDYILMNDIDYSIMKAKQFLPIGFEFDSQYPVNGVRNFVYPFTGTFDGNGFTITNLYLAEYDYITMISANPADLEMQEEVVLTPYYAMFAHVAKDAIVCNLNIKDPIIDLRDIPDGLKFAANLVGENSGTVYNCSVVDKRVNANGEDQSGLSWTLPQGTTTSETFQAAGLVHTNLSTGKIYNSYYVSGNVVNPSCSFRFDTKPVIFNNEGGTIDGVAYNTDLVSEESQTSGGINNYSVDVLESGVGVNINSFNVSSLDVDTITSTKWHFFADDCLPTMEGLSYNDSLDAFEISTDRDLMIFSKILSRISKYNEKNYVEHNYVIKNNIDMTNYQGYVPPKEEFKGHLFGANPVELGSNKNTNKVISNLVLSNPYSTEEEIYYGLLTKCSGTVSNLNFSNCEIQINNEFVSKKTYAGIVCGKLLNGTVEHVLTNSTIKNPDNGGAIGEAYIGGVVGYGNGLINKVANLGDINLGSNLKFDGLTVNAKYQIGGILGGSSESGLTLKDAINVGDITGLGTTDEFSNNLEKIEVAIGGIIGQLNNSTSTNNSVYLVTNDGTISSNRFDGISSSQRCYVYVSGIIGNVIGKSGELGSGSQVLNGQYENNGLIKYKGDAVSNYTTIYNAGILVASTSTYSYFSYMTNNGVVGSTRKNYDLATELKMNSANNNSRIYYAATVIDNSSAGITLSRAYNEFNFVYSNSYFTSGNALIGPFFTSVRNYRSKLLYCTNNGDLSVVGTSVIATTGETRIAGITQSYNVDYENIYVSGNITVGNFKQGAHLYVAGIGWILPYSNSEPNYAKNCLNEGKIVTYNIQGETTITNVSGTGSKDTNFAATITAHNLYVGGLFNLNVGNLTNSMNRADITSLEGSNPEIAGTCNTFVGGLITYNYNLIQDCANSGNIYYTNINESAITNVAGGSNPDCLFGGLIFSYNGGLALGGVCSALADTEALILDDKSNGTADYGHLKTIDAQILDSSNNGNVYGKAYRYVRSGGVLAVALGVEITAGNDTLNSEESAAKTFAYCEVGSGDRIADALLSNGLNFGNICAITSQYGLYNGTFSISVSDKSATYDNGKRPGIFSCAGGVIAYGLCRMVRMINHGVISSCDVAGGIVGATYILGTRNTSNGYSVTTVDINTAVHYGKIKACKSENYNDYSYSIIENIDQNINNTQYFYEDNNSFIFYLNESRGLTYDNLSLYMNKKRGFGGVFGRLQRGNSGVMQSNNFINILNMDENIDMIGRADGTSYGAYYYYKLFVPGREDTYYSARVNDTTPALVVGYLAASAEKMEITSSESIVYTIERTRRYGYGSYEYSITEYTINNASGNYIETLTRNVSHFVNNASSNPNQTSQVTIDKKTGTFNNFTTTYENVDIDIEDIGFSQDEITEITSNNGWSNNTKTYTVQNQNNVTLTRSSSTSVSSYRVEIVTDDPDNTDYTYIFADDFPLMNPAQTNYIYKANNDVLADRFRLSKPNGMYVLASTKGRDAGAVLPANLKINNLYKLKEVDGYVDLGNIQSTDLVNDETSNKPLLDDYKSMFQIKFSDKSLIMHQKTDATLSDIVLKDQNGNGPTLTNGKVNDNDKTITFTVSQDAFKAGNVEYVAKSAELSENAVIAKSGINISTYDGFHEAYVARTSNILTGTYLSSVTGTINLAATTDVTYTLNNKITVYSEIAAQVSGLAETYKTDYTIIIIVDTTAIVLDLNNAVVDGTNLGDPDGDNNTANPDDDQTWTCTQNLVQNGSLTVTMDDVNNILPLNHELICTGLYYGSDKVLEDYYEITTTGKDNNGLMTLGITLSDQLRSGIYTLRFKYYNNVDKEYSVTFTKAASTDYTILDVNYDSYSQTDNIDDTTFVETSSNFETFIGFDVLFGGVSASNDTSQVPISNGVTEPYLNTVEEYQLKIGSTDVATIKLAPFATLTSWSISSEYVNGDFVQTLTYNVKSASNATKSIVHTIKERSLPSMIIYKDGVIQLNNSSTKPVEVKRESLLTEIFIDFGFPNGNSNSNVTYEIGYVDPTNDDASISDNDVKAGITQDANTSYYILNVLSKLEPSVIKLDLSLERATGVSKGVGTIYIKKLQGTNAYLQDIQFQLSENASTVYPTFAEADANGVAVKNSIYDIRGYYAGIDYDGADNNITKNFIIDGKVANEDLENYCPIFTLPIGATIQRITRDDTGNETGRYDDLYANYLGVDDGNGDYITKPIIYEIVSEDGLNKVYYYISVSDLLYNLTLRFNIYFRTADNKIVKASDSSSLIKDNIVVINVVNYELDSNTTYTQGTNGEYPFETIDNEGNSTVTIKDYIVGKYNQSTLFYAPVNESKYLYTFGRNRSGCYKFNVITPIYNGTASEKLVNGARFNYDIYFGKLTDNDSNGIYDTPTGKQLPDFDNTKDYVGKYFFIDESTRNRIRYFSIIIDCSTGDDSWGLTDDDSTWN